jgi:general secretion pathway protein G
MKRARKPTDGGWTFMETIIVLAIIIILTGTVGFFAIRYVARAKTAAAATQLEEFKLALSQYYMDTGDYPSQDQGLEALAKKPEGTDGWDGPYIEKGLPKDPWGRPYIYSKPGPGGQDYGVASLGADGLEGGKGKDSDVTTYAQDNSP